MFYIGSKGEKGNFHHHFNVQKNMESSKVNLGQNVSEEGEDYLQDDTDQDKGRSSKQLFGEINDMIADIKEEHKLNSETLLEANIRQSEYLQKEIANLTHSHNQNNSLKYTSSPIVIKKQLKYMSDKELLVSKQDDETSVYVNITKDSADHDEVDQDGHKLHIHIPHRVLVEMAKSGDDHVIHISMSPAIFNPNYVVKDLKQQIGIFWCLINKQAKAGLRRATQEFPL